MATCRPIDNNTFSAENIRNCERYVFDMQQRLDRAVATNNVGRIRHILDILIHKSWAVKILAVYRITKTNQGKKTAGVDGVAIPKGDKGKADKMSMELLKSIDIKSKPKPIRREYIPKPNGKKRPLGIPTLKDRINQEILRTAIEPIVEYYSHDNSFGFRPKRSCHDAIETLHKKLSRKGSKRYIIEGDIKGCFDNISHNHIISTLKDWKTPSNIRNMIDRMLKAKIFHDGEVYESDKGTPQGGVISPLLANVALTTLDNFISDRFGYRHQYGYSSPMIRYADDFVIVCKSKSEAKDIKEKVSEHLMEHIGLTLSEEKTRITHITDGFNFLGFNIKKHKKLYNKISNDMKDYVLLITPQKDKIQNILSELSSIPKRHKTAPQGAIIHSLNPLIQGWGNYYKFVVSSHIFQRIDHILWFKLLKWGTRRHVNKGKGWVVKRYFNGKGSNFAMPKGATLTRMYDIFSGKRFIKVRQGCRVYCKEDADYWEKREYLKAYDRLYSQTARRLFDTQRGKCPLCKSQIRETDIVQSDTHIHHMKPRAKGGTDRYSNLRLLHSQCHTELHSNLTSNQMNAIVDRKLDYINAFNNIIKTGYHHEITS
jgi:RNA-directed DNA polymerase